MSNQRYHSFVPPTDNNQETVSAEPIRLLQEALEHVQQSAFMEVDHLFLQQSLTILEHYDNVNTLVSELFENDHGIDYIRSSNIRYEEITGSVVFDELEGSGELFMKTFFNPNAKRIANPLISARAYCPEGASLEFAVSYDDETYHTIDVNKSEPLDIPDVDQRDHIKIRVRFQKNEGIELVRLDALSLLYEDETYDLEFLVVGQDAFDSAFRENSPLEYVAARPPEGAVDGVNNTYFIDPDIVEGTEMVFMNGVLQKRNEVYEPQELGTTIVFFDPPYDGGNLLVSFLRRKGEKT